MVGLPEFESGIRVLERFGCQAEVARESRPERDSSAWDTNPKP